MRLFWTESVIVSHFVFVRIGFLCRSTSKSRFTAQTGTTLVLKVVPGPERAIWISHFRKLFLKNKRLELSTFVQNCRRTVRCTYWSYDLTKNLSICDNFQFCWSNKHDKWLIKCWIVLHIKLIINIDNYCIWPFLSFLWNYETFMSMRLFSAMTMIMIETFSLPKIMRLLWVRLFWETNYDTFMSETFKIFKFAISSGGL